MIRYALVCAKGHAFESWFPSSAALRLALVHAGLHVG